MNVRIIHSIECFKGLESAWRALSHDSPESSLFNGFDYAWAWWGSYGSLGQLSIYLVEDDAGEVLAIAPLYKTRSHLTRLFDLSTLRFIGRGGEVAPDDLNVMLCADDQKARQVGELLLKAWQRSDDVQRLLLEELPEQSRFYTLALEVLPCLIESTHVRRVASLPNTWEEFTQSLSRNTRKRIKHRRNRLNAAETLTLHLCTDKDSMLEALAALVQLHKARQASKGEEEAAFSTDEYVQFHENLLDALIPQNAAILVTLRDGDDIVGVEYMYSDNGTLLFYQTGFDPAYESISPGHNMMVFAIEKAIERGLHSIDLLKGDYSYKHSYASDEVTTVMLCSYSSRYWLWLARLLQQARKFKRSSK